MSEQDVQAPVTIPGPESFPVVSPIRRRGVKVTTAAAVALGLALAGSGVAGAASTGKAPSSSSGATSRPSRPPGTGSPPAAAGTVKSTGDGTFTISGEDGNTVTVNVSNSTTYVDPGVDSPGLADVTVGAHVAVFGTDTSNTVTATTVAIGLPPGGGPAGRGGPPGLRPGGSPGGRPGPPGAKGAGNGGGPPANASPSPNSSSK